MKQHVPGGGRVLHAGVGHGLPDAGGGACCMGAAVYGPSRCTCWEPVYDRPQAEPDLTAEPVTRDGMCVDCAFRASSPEKNGATAAAYDQDDLAMLAAPDAATFWCHQGMRLMIGQTHPAGVAVPQPAGQNLAYDPAVVRGVAYKADGRPADRCAGQAALQAAVLRRAAR